METNKEDNSNYERKGFVKRKISERIDNLEQLVRISVYVTLN